MVLQGKEQRGLEGGKEGAKGKRKESSDVQEDDLPMINSAHGSNGARHLRPDNYKERKNAEMS